MQTLIQNLHKRRVIALIVVSLLGLILYISHFFYSLEAPTYFDGKYNMIIANGLIVYKLIELPILYYLLMKRYINKIESGIPIENYFTQMSKHTKLLYFLIPQGNIVFGLISYKLSGSIFYYLLFTSIGVLTLIFINPKKFEKYSISAQP